MKRLLLLLAAFTSIPAAARNGPETITTKGLNVECRVAFRRAAARDLPVPITLVIRNQTGNDLRPDLEIELFEHSDRAARRIVLPAHSPDHSRKRIHLCVDLRDGQYNRIRLRLRRRGTTYWEWQREGLVRDTDARIWVATIDAHANAVKMPAPTASSGDGRHDGNYIPPMASRTMESIGLTPVELPDSDAPLHGFYAVILTSTVPHRAITDLQLRALANYVIAGGMVLLPARNEALRRKLLSRLPLPPTRPPQAAPPLTLQPAGNGLLAWYDNPLFGNRTEAETGRRAIRRQIETRPQPGFPKFLAPGRWDRGGPTPQATRNIFLLLAGFALFTICIGPVSLLFWKARKRTIILYVVTTVTFFSLLTAALAIYSRTSAGAARWLTVTELTPDGGVQRGYVTAVSSGGRKHRLEIAGNRPEAWLLNVRDHHAGRHYGLNSFRQTTNIGLDIAAPPNREHHPAFNLPVPITPWGARTVLARDYAPANGTVEIRVELVKLPQSTTATAVNMNSWGQPQIPPTHPARIKIAAKNNTPYALTDCSLTVGIYTHMLQPYSNTGESEETDVYQTFNLPQLAPGAATRTAVRFRPLDRERNLGFHRIHAAREITGQGQFVRPRLQHRDRLYAVFAARIPASPSLAIKAGDLIPTAGKHLVVQLIDPLTLPQVTGIAKTANDYGTPQPATPTQVVPGK